MLKLKIHVFIVSVCYGCFSRSVKMGKTKFQESWKKNRPWLRAATDSIYKARCTACKKDMSTESGVGVIERHEKRDSHKSNVKTPNQCSFSVDTSGTVSMTGKTGKTVLSSEQQKWNAEILRALNVVDKNHSFRSCEADTSLYKRMFPDSKIAGAYSQGKTKVKYIIEYGIAPHIREIVMKDIKERPFTFHFDETTTSQVKKQYDGYVTYYSLSKKEIRTSYCGTLFVGRCTAEDLITHFYEFMKKVGLDPTFMLSLGMDGPNVNILFQKKLLNDLSIINIGTCPLHVVSIGFGKAVLSIKGSIVDLDEMAIDFYFFFKRSAARREEFKRCEELTGVVSKHLEKHCATRWISLERVLVKLNEQWENLKEYFLNKLPTLPEFKGKNGVGATSRYTRIKNYLNNQNILIAMGFVVFLARDFQKFIKSLETNEPMIHLLYSKSMELLRCVLDKFLKSEVLMRTRKNKSEIISPNDLVELDVRNSAHHKAKLNVGSRAERLLQNVDALEKKKISMALKNALVDCSTYLLEKLPITEQVIYDAQFIGYQSQSLDSPKKAANAIKRLAMHVANALGPVALRKEFNLKEGASADDLVDLISEEFKLYQLEAIPKSYTEATPDEKLTRKERPSYWRYAYGLMDVEQESEHRNSVYTRIDHYWKRVANILDEEGKPKFAKLSTLVNCLLTLSHGNAEPERGFSINKNQLDLHGSGIGESTLESLRVVKDYLMRNGGIKAFNVSKELIAKCEKAHSQ